MAQPSEHELIRRYFRPLAGPEGLDLVDDAASLAPEPGFDLVITNDMVVEDVHFLDDPADAVAAKALRVNLSDLAAKGAEPVGYVVALGLSASCDEAWVARFAEGLAADQQRYGIRLMGGDTSMGGERITVAITAVGRVPAGKMVRRSTARPGDDIYVTGTIGDAALGLFVRKGRPLGSASAADHLLRRYRYPEPRVALAPLVGRYATAAMDVSDGLVGDLAKLCAASNVGAEIRAGDVPLSQAAGLAIAAESVLLETALTGGDDYEILLTAAPENGEALASGAAELGIALTRIGRTTETPAPPIFLDPAGRPMTFQRTAYDHFAGQAG